MAKPQYDLTPRFPKKFRPVRGKGRAAPPWREGPEVDEILDWCEKQGFLVLSLRDGSRRKLLLQNAWWRRCEEKKNPYTLVFVDDEGNGYFHYDMYPQPRNLSEDSIAEMGRKLGKLYDGLSEDDQLLVDSVVPHGGLYTLSNALGDAGFTKEIAGMVIRIMLLHLPWGSTPAA